MNYTLVAENTTKRHLRVEVRATVTIDHPELYFYEEDPVATSRLHSLSVHDKRGKEIEIKRIRHGAWKLEAIKGTNVCITYVLHAFVMSPTETYVSADTWIVNPKSSLMSVEGLKDSHPTITLSSSDTNFIFASKKEIQSDLEGYAASFNTMDEMYRTTIMGGTYMNTYTMKEVKINLKGEIGSVDISTLCKTLEKRFEANKLDSKISILLYIVPGHIEKRALVYGEEHGLYNSFMIIPTSDILEKELMEKIIYSIEYHYYANISLSIEKKMVPWFVEGFSQWNTIQQMKSIWTKEEYRLRVERCYIRTFSLDRELKETVIDSGHNKTSTLSRDAGSVLCHQLSILFKGQDLQWEPFNNSMTETIGSCYSGDLKWLWSLSLYAKDLSGWLEVCKRYVRMDGWKLECPKRGPVKVIYI
jgi:hypothetical protein